MDTQRNWTNANGTNGFNSYFTGRGPGIVQPQPMPTEAEEDVIEVRVVGLPLVFSIQRVVVMFGDTSVNRRVRPVYIDNAGRRITCVEELVVATGCCGAPLHVDSAVTCDECGRYLCRSCAEKWPATIASAPPGTYKMVCPHGCISEPMFQMNTKKANLLEQLHDY